ncbi:RHS repeat-associated core domain-containing protein [Salinibacterium sp. SYSU T00001]|uniref:RHS repeat-associated core domain-containing protein n=1 Tax=Homoserinimonas sedimenticola TaxID=2986805 RepID=UPI0022355FFE|nr:RHS repeat-associated core domain-containing protein [Salinibacterium sedimenticola]MCW4384712.1 RHS repeat-associated core domain-containing protein [Salinibacterium sedimenticola]
MRSARGGPVASGAAAGTIDYTYDAAGRLTATTADTTSWAYDAAGNQTVNGITGQTATYNSRGAVTSIGAGTYEGFGQGNTTQLGRVASSTTTSYLTSGLGLMGEELSGAVGSQRGFTRTPEGDAVGARLGGGSRYYYVTDHLNSVVGMFSKTGTYYGGYSYSPYSEQRAISADPDIGKNNLRYISGYWDEASGLYKLGARYYDASTGRFTQFDPSGQEANPYSYAACNPINGSDPTGLYNDLGKCAHIAGGYGLVVGGAIAGAFTGGIGLVIGLAGLGLTALTIALYPETTYC